MSTMITSLHRELRQVVLASLLLLFSTTVVAEVLHDSASIRQIALTLEVADRPDDNGGALVLSWSPKTAGEFNPGIDDRYSVERANSCLGPFEILAGVSAEESRYVDLSAELFTSYFYRVELITDQARTMSNVVGPVFSTYQWVNRGAWNLLLFGGLILAVLYRCIHRARSRGAPSLRRLAGVEAIDKAISLSAETGRPLYYTMGTQDINEVQTVASMAVLGEVSQMVSIRDAELIVPHTYALTMTVADDVIRRGYEKGGRPESWQSDNNFFVSGEQFGYAMGVTGMISHDNPVACIYVGSFYAEALTLAETGRAYGAYQVAGTAEAQQIPFFIAACDEVLIGEEIFVAAAQLSGDPVKLGCVWAQDLCRLVVTGTIVGGVAIAGVAAIWRWPAALQLRDIVLRLLAGH